MPFRLSWLVIIGAAVLISSCNQSTVKPAEPTDPLLEMRVSSTAFGEGEMIPQKYTCDGENISPPLLFQDVPESAQSLILIVDDPDAPTKTWNHWLLYDIPPHVVTLSGGLTTDAEIPGIGKQGQNDFNKLGYGGPCPPGGKAHRYLFTLLALDEKLNMPSGATRGDLENAIKGHVIAQGQLIGKYGR